MKDHQGPPKLEKDVAQTRTPTEQVKGPADLSGFQVLRKEFSSHKFDAAITLSQNGISFNSACIRFYEHTNHVQILIDEKNNRIAIRSCNQYEHNAMQWARNQQKDDKRVPRPIKAPPACDRLFKIMGWNEAYRYKMLGTRKIFDDADVVLFLMDEAEIFVTEHETLPDGKVVRKSHNFLPPQWQDSFCDYVEDHDRKQSLDMLSAIKLFNTPDGTKYFVTPQQAEISKKPPEQE